MNKLSKKQVGFTLIEMLAATLIVAIMAGAAIIYYIKAVERMRVTEVVTLMGSVVSAQQHKFLLSRNYTKEWHKLDVQPSQVRVPSANNPYSNEDNTVFYTRGKDSNGQPRSGFAVYFENNGPKWYMVADRVANPDYVYTLIRPFDERRVYCIPAEDNQKSVVLCADFMGVDPEDLLEDPRSEGD